MLVTVTAREMYSRHSKLTWHVLPAALNRFLITPILPHFLTLSSHTACRAQISHMRRDCVLHWIKEGKRCQTQNASMPPALLTTYAVSFLYAHTLVPPRNHHHHRPHTHNESAPLVTHGQYSAVQNPLKRPPRCSCNSPSLAFEITRIGGHPSHSRHSSRPCTPWTNPGNCMPAWCGCTLRTRLHTARTPAHCRTPPCIPGTQRRAHSCMAAWCAWLHGVHAAPSSSMLAHGLTGAPACSR